MKKQTATEADIIRFLSRGVEKLYPSREFVEERLIVAHTISIYYGIDPTGPSLHIGHAIPLRKLRDFQRLGGKVVLLIGDFTAMIGDPTDKGAARVRLTHKEVLENAKLYKKQAEKFLDFEGANAAELRYNSEWLKKMSFEDVVELSSHFTVQQMLERDMFDERAKSGKPIYLHEFLYPLMQGYDSVALKTDGEIGGNDQTFNMLAGRNLVKQIQNREKFVLTTKLLTDPSGKKMGKSEGNIIALTDDASEMYGKVMSWTDPQILPGLELCTDVSEEEIAEIAAKMQGGENPKLYKMRLAREIVSFYHGSEAATKAEASFGAAFSDGAMPADAPVAKASKGASLIDVLLEAKIVESKTEARRLFEEGAISIIGLPGQGGEKIGDPSYAIEKSVDLKVGKRRFLRIELS